VPFNPPRYIPGLKPDTSRVLLAALNAIGIDLRAALSTGFTPTAVLTQSGQAKIGQLVLLAPPPGVALPLLIPTGSLANRGQAIQLGVLAVGTGGSVVVSVVGGEQRINDAPTLTLITPGVTQLISGGPNGWLAAGSGGGSSGGGTDPRIFAWWGV